MIDALKYFKAECNEKKVERIANHHDHVRRALDAFKQMRNQEQTIDEITSKKSIPNLGAQVTTAVSLLKLFLQDVHDNEERMQIVQLQSLVERGVISDIAKRLQRMQKDLVRKKIGRDEALEGIKTMAKKYNAYYLNSEELRRETETEADIILSESFK
ncbi:hypothetical protein HMPREF9303_2160 [Prevotella denticola CRIS 18C-A]|uniref:Uncharacterized protein n=1 Tax=Prevotella denticola CRIS 18C-A TaxID=944557 RepID=F0H448_9BACT|nr:hypothetical protein HMPREF9303_2160 [Prevotella denticola CRIS 18C-A]